MMKMFLRVTLLSICISLSAVYGKQLFTPEKLKKYMTLKNPYIYAAIGKKYIDKAKIKTVRGVFDTKFSLMHEKKNYPLSTANFSDITMSKPIENGTEFLLGFRKAEGVQEYNNIKTGKDGEFRVGVNVPVSSFLLGTNERKYKVDTTLNQYVQSELNAQNNVRNLSARIFSDYYKSIYLHELFKLETALLKKAKKRDTFIRKRVNSGDLPEVSMLESEQQVIGRKQRVLTIQNQAYMALQSLLRYLNLDDDTFSRRYRLPSLKVSDARKTILEDLFKRAMQKRPDIKILEQKRKKLALDEGYNRLSKYPKVNLYAYGVYDEDYGEGTKVGFRLEMPLERRSYEGKKIEISQGMIQIEEEKKRLMLEVKANLLNLTHSLEIMYKNIHFIHQKIALAEALEEVENKKYEQGSSSLFQLNQREIITLEAKQKRLEANLNILLIQQEIKREIAEYDIF